MLLTADDLETIARVARYYARRYRVLGLEREDVQQEVVVRMMEQERPAWASLYTYVDVTAYRIILNLMRKKIRDAEKLSRAAELLKADWMRRHEADADSREAAVEWRTLFEVRQ